MTYATLNDFIDAVEALDGERKSISKALQSRSSAKIAQALHQATTLSFRVAEMRRSEFASTPAFGIAAREVRRLCSALIASKNN